MPGTTPVLQALVLADHVYVDAGTGKKVICGTFNSIRVEEVPSALNLRSFAYICLTDVYGRLTLALHYVDLETNETLIHTTFEVESPSPVASVELIVEVPPLPVPHAGTYAFEIHSGGEMVGFLRVTATLSEKKQEG